MYIHCIHIYKRNYLLFSRRTALVFVTCVRYSYVCEPVNLSTQKLPHIFGVTKYMHRYKQNHIEQLECMYTTTGMRIVEWNIILHQPTHICVTSQQHQRAMCVCLTNVHRYRQIFRIPASALLCALYCALMVWWLIKWIIHCGYLFYTVSILYNGRCAVLVK